MGRYLTAIHRIWNHPTNRGDRVSHLIAALDHELRRRILGDYRWVLPTGTECLLFADSPSSSELRIFRYPSLEHRLVIEAAPGSIHCVDVGANVGQFLLHVAHKLGPGGRALAIEPSLEAFRRLNLQFPRDRYPQVSLVQCALSRERGRAFLASPTPADPGAKLCEDCGAEEVEVRRLDDLADRVGDRLDLLKIDVEGRELDVLIGGEAVLERLRPPYLLFEYNHNAVERGSGSWTSRACSRSRTWSGS